MTGTDVLVAAPRPLDDANALRVFQSAAHSAGLAVTISRQCFLSNKSIPRMLVDVIDEPQEYSATQTCETMTRN